MTAMFTMYYTAVRKSNNLSKRTLGQLGILIFNLMLQGCKQGKSLAPDLNFVVFLGLRSNYMAPKTKIDAALYT